MGFYAFITGIGTILVISFFWTVFMHTVDLTTTTFTSITPSDFAGYQVDTADVTAQYTLANNAFYFFLLFLSIVIFVWIIKSSVKEQEHPFGGGY